jgi:spore germination cell wall hydrolase CwlJ-like protein
MLKLNLSDKDLLTLCVFEEANLEPADGKAAIVKVLEERVRLHYMCNGTFADAIERRDQFSWVNWAMIAKHYTEVATTLDQEITRIEQLDKEVQGTAAWKVCAAIVEQVLAGAYHGDLFNKLIPGTVLYYNPAITDHTPPWATPDKLVVVIGHHHFFHQ